MDYHRLKPVLQVHQKKRRLSWENLVFGFFFILDVVTFLLIHNIDSERYFYNSEIENNLSTQN